MNKLRIKEVIVCEGRDDSRAIQSALDCMTIETHGFGIKKGTWELLEKAYSENGLIIFTDPDFSGEEIRRKLKEKFPDAKEAFLTRKEAESKGDIGIENAKAEDILDAIKKAHVTVLEKEDIFVERDLYEAGLIGREDSKERREALGRKLGIGYSNGKTLLKKLNRYTISKEDFDGALQEIDN